MTVSIRCARQSDVSLIAAFNVAMALETEGEHLAPATVHAGVKAALESASLGRYFVAETAEEVTACLMITYEWSDWRNGLMWWIQSVYVTPAYRQQGIFKRMYEHVRKTASDANAAGLRLYVERENHRAQNTYKALGMTETHYRLYEDLF